MTENVKPQTNKISFKSHLKDWKNEMVTPGILGLTIEKQPLLIHIEILSKKSDYREMPPKDAPRNTNSKYPVQTAHLVWQCLLTPICPDQTAPLGWQCLLTPICLKI